MSRPTVSLACILKNEAKNIGPMLSSVKGCFDEIIMVDTGSTDNSVDFLEKINKNIEANDPNWQGYPKIKIEHFEWINDFAAARNYAFSKATSDYIFWMDLDDSMSDAKAFIHWRDNVMHAAHYWVALYNYAFSSDGKPACQFIRERVTKRDFGFKWEYFVHEGQIPTDGRKFWPNRVTSWWINHRRDAEDMKQDHLRNINLFESRDYETLPPRMKFYYGKELLENGFPEKAGKPLHDALKSGQLDIHDNILSIQYASQSALSAKQFAIAQDLCLNGIRIMPSRAEYWCILADIYLGQGDTNNACLALEFALQCKPNDLGGIVVVAKDAYDIVPHSQLASIYLNTGSFDAAKPHIDWLLSIQHPIGPALIAKYEEVKDMSTVRVGLPKTQDIIITCPPGCPITDWDDRSLEAKGHGGSETAAIEVAKWLKKKTNRPVKVFQTRIKREEMPSGVQYLPINELQGYLQNIEPSAHIAWRHSTKLTQAKSIVWCHDLQCPAAEATQNYDKIMALSEFHKNYLMETQRIPADKILLGFNGINPQEFEGPPVERDPLKVIFSSSPDRGLVQAIDIVKKARDISGLDLKLHCFYGFENMRKGGQGAWADQIEAHIKKHDFVKHHGFVPKKELYQHFKESGCWLYVNDFIETYCLTAIEALCCGTWPIVRDMGALKYTMKEALQKGMCDFMNVEITNEATVGLWANTLVEAIIERKWNKVEIKPQDYSWEKVAEFFIKEFEL